MSRRSSDTNLGFGSDSFLDIVANIVGILIILIVLAGVRVSKTPVLTERGDAPPSIGIKVSELLKPSPPPVPAIRDTSAANSLDAEVPEAELTSPVAASQPPAEPSPTLLARIKDLKQQQKNLATEEAQAVAQLQQLSGKERSLQMRLANFSQTLQSANKIRKTTRQQIDLLSKSLNESKKKLENHKKSLQTAQQEKAPVEKIEHKLTPLSKVVTGNEVHFRLVGNQLAIVPLNELIDRLKAQIQRQKEWLLKFRRHQGHVGPIRGFTMNYVVERQSLSVIDELRYGRGVMRIGVSQWQVEPDVDLKTITEGVALMPGSEFYRTLLTATSDTTLTFWVYPDSYRMYRRLQKVAQAEGFTVAARPMPFGVPIAGSPNGTRSAGQ